MVPNWFLDHLQPFFGLTIFWSGAKNVLLYWLQVSLRPDCKNLGSGVPSLLAADKPCQLNYNLPYLDLPNLLRAHPIWRPYPHVRPQFGSKLGWIDLLQSIDEKKANAHLGRSFSDVFRWHKGHSQITLAILKNGTELDLNQRFEYFLDHRKFSKVKMFLKPVWVGKIHGVGVYATHSVRIWWFRNNFSLFQLKRM